MARMDEAPTPDILYTETANASIVTPAAGNQKLFVDTDHIFKYKNSSGTVSAVSTGLTNPLTTTGDIIYSSSGTTAARLAVGTANQVLHGGASVPAYSAVVEGDLSTSDITTANATTSKHGFTPKYPNDATKYLDGTGAYTVPAGGGGGTTLGQAIAYPTTFTGDDDDFASFSNWVDVSAFDTAEILNSTVGHLVTKGASKDQKKRFTLGTTKAAAYDFRWWGVLPDLTFWSTAGDAYVDLALKTSADGHIAGFRLLPQVLATNWYNILVQPVVSGSVITTTVHPLVNRGLGINLRITRDGSNNHAFYIGTGQAPVAFARYLNASDDVPYTPTPSGTIARAEILIHTPSGPGSTAEFGMYIDKFQSV